MEAAGISKKRAGPPLFLSEQQRTKLRKSPRAGQRTRERRVVTLRAASHRWKHKMAEPSTSFRVVLIDQDNVQALATERNELKFRVDAAEQEAKRATSGLAIAERELSDTKTRLGAAEEAEEEKPPE